jgi:hypothetical protein
VPSHGFVRRGEVKDFTRYFIVPPSEISYVGFIVHAYEGLAVVRTLNADVGLIEMLVAPDLRDELDALLAGLSKELDIREMSHEEVAAWGMLDEREEGPDPML